jgi:hypothetical protein
MQDDAACCARRLVVKVNEITISIPRCAGTRWRMAIDIESGLVFNSIFWLTSPRPDETNMVDSMIDDYLGHLRFEKDPVSEIRRAERRMLIRALAEIEEATRGGLKPLVLPGYARFFDRRRRDRRIPRDGALG